MSLEYMMGLAKALLNTNEICISSLNLFEKVGNQNRVLKMKYRECI